MASCWHELVTCLPFASASLQLVLIIRELLAPCRRAASSRQRMNLSLVTCHLSLIIYMFLLKSKYIVL